MIFSTKIGGTGVGVVRFGQLHQLTTNGHGLLNIDEKATLDCEHNRRTVEKDM